MKLILFLVIAGVLATEQNHEPFSSSDIADFLKGFLKGLNEKGDVKELLKCTVGLEDVMNDIIKAVNLIGTWNFKELMEGFKLLYNAVVTLVNTLKPCCNSFKELTKFMVALMKTNVFQLVLKFLNNPGPYVQDIIFCIQGFIDKKYEAAGKNLGDFLYRLILRESDFNPEMKDINTIIWMVYEFAQGIVDGLNKGETIQNVDMCIDSLPVIWMGIKRTIEEFKKLNWTVITEVLPVFRLLLDDLVALLMTGKPCSRAISDIKFLIKCYSNVNPKVLMNRIIHNVMNIVHCFTHAIKHLKGSHYHDCGEDLGQIIYFLILKKD